MSEEKLITHIVDKLIKIVFFLPVLIILILVNYCVYDKYRRYNIKEVLKEWWN